MCLLCIGDDGVCTDEVFLLSTRLFDKHTIFFHQLFRRNRYVTNRILGLVVYSLFLLPSPFSFPLLLRLVFTGCVSLMSSVFLLFCFLWYSDHVRHACRRRCAYLVTTLVLQEGPLRVASVSFLKRLNPRTFVRLKGVTPNNTTSYLR